MGHADGGKVGDADGGGAVHPDAGAVSVAQLGGFGARRGGAVEAFFAGRV
jgi:hypothetical protein